jgi:hypothetical protein
VPPAVFPWASLTSLFGGPPAQPGTTPRIRHRPAIIMEVAKTLTLVHNKIILLQEMGKCRPHGGVPSRSTVVMKAAASSRPFGRHGRCASSRVH